MDIYGMGQCIGELMVCYCKKKGIDIDRAVSEVEKNNLMFVHGLFDGIGSSRENGTATNNFILDNYKL